MKPARQGDLDGFCGLYAVVNALDLVGVRGPRRGLPTKLFYQLAKGLGHSGLLAGLSHGLTADDLRAASRPAFRWLQREHGIRLKLVKPFASAEFFDVGDFVQLLRIQTRKVSGGAIVHVQTHGSAHWTVVRSISGGMMTLRDSKGTAVLSLDQYGIGRGARFFRPSETLVICRLNDG